MMGPMVEESPSSYPKTIFDLNDDCIFHIFRYLPLMESLKFAYACDIFDDVVITSLKCKTLSVSDCQYFISPSESNKILSRFGAYVQRLDLNETVEGKNLKIYKYLAEYCCNIRSIKLHYPARVEFETYLSLVHRIMSIAKDIETVHIERKNFVDDWPNPWYYRVLEEQICEMISNLEFLRNLHLTHFYKASGKFLNKLTNLKHLNIEYCINFKSEHFISLCNSMKLKSLNIDNCTFLNEETLEILVQTQTDLEKLTINTEFDARNFKNIGRMKSLKELIVYDYYGGNTLDELVNEIVEHHRDDFRVLKIFTNAPNTVENHKMFQKQLLALKNLQVLCLPYECLAENYLLEIGMTLPKLEKLRFNIEEDRRGGCLERRTLPRKFLPPDSGGFLFRVEHVRPIVETRRFNYWKPLTIYLDFDHISDSLYESREYTDNFDVLRIVAVFN